MGLLAEYLLSFLWAFFVSVFAIPSIIQVAHQKNILNKPVERSVHENDIPRLGGLAIFAGMASSFTLFGQFDKQLQLVFGGALVIFYIGLKDDIVHVSATKKFFVQFLAALIVILLGDLRLRSFQDFLGLTVLDPGVSYFITILIIVGITNAYNLIDGLDGLAGTQSFVAAISLAFWFVFENLPSYALLSFAVAGGIAGFLRFNIRNAIIFMGDAGSLVCGFMLACLSLLFVHQVPHSGGIAMVTAALWIPAADTLRVFLFRISNGLSPFTPDKNHLHHRLLDLGLNHFQVVALLCALQVLAIVAATYFRYTDITMLIFAMVVAGIGVMGVVELLWLRKMKKAA